MYRKLVREEIYLTAGFFLDDIIGFFMSFFREGEERKFRIYMYIYTYTYIKQKKKDKTGKK